ncbi:MAG TPA: NAD-dependent epimerase/dehydratase family protein [Mycobacteriales bacterium]|nr:NAD-dependent epimerase/dehydratase family protein [Mycobacteriales bacterium]
MRLLVLGGTRFVGRSLVADALDRGWQVDAVSRGVSGALPAGARPLRADRTDPRQLATALGDQTWDLVVDTWALAPEVVQISAAALRGRTGRYGYVSTCSVYAPGSPPGGTESAPVVSPIRADQSADSYPADKRAGELAALEVFPDALLARAGLILGPHEDIGRLPWWLARVARGGRMLAPGRPGRPWQYVDARDLATWMLDGLASGLSGPVDVISPVGHTTTGDLLAACLEVTGSDAELVWVAEERLAAAGIEPWRQLPAWLPEDSPAAPGLIQRDTSLAASTGLRCRPARDTVADTWAWLQRDGWPPPRRDRPPVGLPEELERVVLAAESA